MLSAFDDKSQLDVQNGNQLGRWQQQANKQKSQVIEIAILIRNRHN